MTDLRPGIPQPSSLFDDAPRPTILRWCRICERVGKKNCWPKSDALIGPRGTAHFQKDESWADTTVCGLDATKDGWLWPT